MPLQEAFDLVNGKAIPGTSWLRDTSVGMSYDVLSVTSGQMPTPIDLTVDKYGHSAAGRCAMYGGPIREMKAG